ncbi:family 43 glycosylhydrolase [Cellulomonas sp. DKR-3]|uniref:Family 43 glycosylhydrolase n=1 Tax=Cellulomonas fulva TaxID=2835530 RepID=A0ABS5TX96_9CELL|nr:family 43 glycosylhydrolase [Cellulomonas fulva]MBT0993726.1 family 43 glycosylhydrolase [Cellulomonas fulva]
MILEHAVLQVVPGRAAEFERAFDEARRIIGGMPGFRGLRLERGVEDPTRYLLLVEWDRLEDHTEGFRGSPQYDEWRALLHHFYDPFPEVDHYAPAATQAASTAPALPAPPLALPVRPVLPGFHPDPTVCRVGEDVYLACSSFEYAPGVPVLRSRDLATWELVGHALDRPSQLALAGVGASGGVYAPTLRHHDGRFYLVTSNVNDGPGHILVTATDAAGPWSEPVRIDEVGGIDPDLAWDQDGTCYLTWSDGGIVQAVLDPTTGRLLSDPRPLWSGTGGRDPEGPHLYRVGEHWYLLVSEGGTGAGHAVSVARGPAPYGPFEPCPDNPFLTARATPHPVQNAGHADLVELADGTWAAVFLGVRPSGRFPSWHVLGRETFAARVAWEDGWPRVVAPIEPSDEAAVPPDELTDALPPSWVGSGVFPADVLRRTDDGWVLTARPDERTFVGHRQEHPHVTACARVDAADGVGGIEVRIDPWHALTLEVDGGVARAVARVGHLVQELGSTPVGPDDELELRAVPSTASEYSRERGPDEVVAAVRRAGASAGDEVVELGRIDGRYLSTEVAGGFTGRMVGLVCRTGSVAVRSYRCARD